MEFLFFTKIERIASINPKITIVGASFILLKLKISGLKTLGSLLPPPDINKKPNPIIVNDINKKHSFFFQKEFFFDSFFRRINRFFLFLNLNTF